MGVLVSGPGAFCSSVLPPLPPQPAVCNLDVTTMCALVSEVSNGDPARPSVQQWAQRVTHWKVSTDNQHAVNLQSIQQRANVL